MSIFIHIFKKNKNRFKNNFLIAIFFMARNRIQKVVILFLMLVLLIFLGVTITAYLINAKKRQIFIQSNIDQIKRSVNLAYSYESNRVNQVLFSYSFWDEMVDFVEKGERVDWAKANVDPIISTFQVDALWIFDTSQKIKYCKAQENQVGLNSFRFESSAFDSILRNKFVRYYVEVSDGIVEVFGTTIHPSMDPQRKTKPRGFLFVGRYCSNKYVNDLSAITLTKMSIVSDTLQGSEEKGKYRVIFNIPLKTLEDRPLKYLHVEKSSDYFEEFEKLSLRLVVLYYISAIVIFITLTFVFSKWINKPLLIVENVLEKNDAEKAAKLNQYGHEFAKIGQLISSYISQKRVLEELKDKAEESDRLKTAFMSNMSHEIRTPLNGILGFSELLCKANPSEETAENYRKIIQKCSNSLMRLIGDILDYSKIEAGQLIINNEKFSTETLFAEISNHYESKRESLSRKGIDLIFSDLGETTSVSTDKLRLKQILFNLIGNAIKFTEKGTIEVTCTKEESRLIFQVRDTGIGISEELQHIIFERFWQAAQPKSKLYGGMGLGLALSKGLVTLLGGQIRVESQVGVGSTFFVEIPVELKEG